MQTHRESGFVALCTRLQDYITALQGVQCVDFYIFGFDNIKPISRTIVRKQYSRNGWRDVLVFVAFVCVMKKPSYLFVYSLNSLSHSVLWSKIPNLEPSYTDKND